MCIELTYLEILCTEYLTSVVSAEYHQYNCDIFIQVSLVCAAHGHGMADPYVYWIKGLGPGFGKTSTQLLYFYLFRI